MALFFLMYLCLIGDIQSASEVPATLNKDSGLLSTDTTPHATTLNYRHTSTATATHEWEATTNVSANAGEIASLKTQLDDLFDRIITASHSFSETENRTMLEFTMNLTKNYEDISKTLLQTAELQNLCQNCTKFQKHECDETWEYQVKLEMVQILSDELHKMTSNGTEFTQTQIVNDSKNNGLNEILSFLEELQRIITLNRKVRQLSRAKKEFKFQTFEDIDDIIGISQDLVDAEKDIIHITENSKKMISLFEEEYGPKLTAVRNLVNPYIWKEKLEQHEEGLRIWQNHKAQHQTYDTVRLVVMPVGFGVIFILGIIGNGVLLMVFINHKDMRTAPNVMIINLTVADTLGVILNVLVLIFRQTITFTWGHAVCQMYHFLTRMVVGVSIYSVVAISVQRFIVITGIFKFDGSFCLFFGKCKCFWNVIFVWVFTAFVPLAYGVNAKVDPHCAQTESADPEFNKILAYVNFFVYLVLPFIVITLTSGYTSWYLKHKINQTTGESVCQERVKKARVVNANILVALIVVFAVCYTPMFCFTLYISFGITYTYTLYYIHSALYWLMCCITCYNPIVLYIGSAKYRKYMNMYLCYRFGKRKSTATSDVCFTSVTNMQDLSRH